MRHPTHGLPLRACRLLGAFCLGVSAVAQEPASTTPLLSDPDSATLVLARKYREGGDGARTALLDALQRMGWGVRDAQGAVLQAPPPGADTGLAMRDYELEELLWKPAEQPQIRLISFAQALAVPFEDADPEELAQDLVETIRHGAVSTQPQQRFWARFIVALGRVDSANYDLTAPAPAAVIPPSKAQLKEVQQVAAQNPLAAILAAQTTPVWADDDPVLAPSPRPQRAAADTRTGAAERDKQRLHELSGEMGRLSRELAQADPARRKAAQEKMTALQLELTAIAQRQQAAATQQMGAALRQFESGQTGDNKAVKAGPRFLAEWRDQPLSLLQVALVTRVLAADLHLAASRAGNPPGLAAGRRGHWPARLPLATVGLAQAGGPPSTFSGQFSGAAGDIWANGWGAYTGQVLDHHLPENRFTKGTAIANTIIAWFKTIMTVARQNITIVVEDAPLLRTKTRTAGEKRTARCKVQIDFPKSDVLKAIRAAGNLVTLDLQLPEGGPVGGAKVVWRLPEGSYNTKYQAGKGGWVYKPELAVVQFAEAGGPAAYISYTNDEGEATITIEGVPQRRTLSANVRPYPRRAVIAVEVTIKVGNLTQDLNDAISAALGGPIVGGLGFIADMVLRTSFFFQKGKVFEVTDWKEPAWEGDFVISVAGAGSKHEKGEKGGPDSDYSWRMNRAMKGLLHTPDWEEETEMQNNYQDYGRHTLEVDGQSRDFRLDDSSSSHTRNSENHYEAVGPIQVQPPGPNQLELLSRAEPSGSATLMFTGGIMQLDLKPFFLAECAVGRSEQSHGRSSSKAGTEDLSLLNGVEPDTFTIIEPYDGTSDTIDGTKEIDGHGNLPYVPGFDVTIIVKYHLKKYGPPPKNKQ